MGSETECAIFKIRLQSGNPIFKAKAIRVVQQIRLMDAIRGDTWDGWRTFGSLFELTLEYTGNDVDAFVVTIEARLYGQSHERNFNLLSERDRLIDYANSKIKLSTLYSFSLDSKDITVWIAGTLGLSNLILDGRNVTPMHFLNGHGESLRRRNAGAIVIVNCSRCDRNFLIRMALPKSVSSVLGVKRYRIPGLKYSITKSGRAGFLLQDGNILGRLILL